MSEPCPTCSGPVRVTVGMVCQTCGTDYAPESIADRLRRAARVMRERAEASWHPAVADWLDAEAAGIDLYTALDAVAIEIGGGARVTHSTHAQALAVADAYLGDS